VIGCEEDVARMRIGMEDAIDQDLMKVGAKQVVAERHTIDLGPLHAADRRDLYPVDVVHRQDPRRRVVVDRQRDDDALEITELMCEGRRCALPTS
jgi:hypothetical protein